MSWITTNHVNGNWQSLSGSPALLNTASFQPGANKLLLFICMHGMADDYVASIANHDGGLSWTQIFQFDNLIPTHNRVVEVWACKTGSSPSNTYLAVTFDSSYAYRGIYSVVEIDEDSVGVDLSSLAAAFGVSGADVGGYNPTASPLEITLASFAGAGNMTFAINIVESSNATATAFEGDYVSVGGQEGPSWSQKIAYRAQEDNSVEITFNNYIWGAGCAFEVCLVAGGGETRNLIADIAGASATPAAQAALIRSLLAGVLGASETGAAAALLTRSLSAGIAGASATPEITATMLGLINLVAAIAGVSVAPDIMAVVQRSMAAGILAQSATPAITAVLLRALSAAIAAVSATPDIAAVLINLVSLSAGIQGISLTPGIAASLARTLSAVIAAQSATPGIAATTARMLLADIQGSSVTPDDLILILAGLGAIIDPAIESLTVQRGLSSVTVARELETLTVNRSIHAA